MSTNATARESLAAFRRQAVKMPPIRGFRPALWENMLGTVYAANVAGQADYFDYRYTDALAHVGPFTEVRVSKARDVWYGLKDAAGYDANPRRGQRVWFVR